MSAAMKKTAAAIAAAAIFSIAVVFALSLDAVEAVDVEKNEYGGYTVISRMKSGETAEMFVYCSVKPLAEGVYHVRISMGERNFTDAGGKDLQSSHYGVGNIRADLHISGEPVIEYAACSGGIGSDGPAPASPRLSYGDGEITVSCETSGQNLGIDVFVIGDFEMTEIGLTYDVMGKGIRGMNRVGGNRVKVGWEG